MPARPERGLAAAVPAPAEPGLEVERVLARAAPRWSPELRSQLAEVVQEEARRNGYDPLFVLALVSVESRFHLGVSSERGARGLLQLMPSTFAWMSAREPDAGGEEVDAADDPAVDVRLAVRYFRWLEQRFHSRDAALMAYNAGPGRYSRFVRSGQVPDRLVSYARSVRREYDRFRTLSTGARDPSEPLLAEVEPQRATALRRP